MEVWKNAFRMKTRTKTLLCLTSVVALVSVGGVATHASFNDTGFSSITAKSGNLSYKFTTPPESWWGSDLFYNQYMIGGKSYSQSSTIQNDGTIPMKYTAVMSPDIPLDMGSSFQAKVVIDSVTVYTGTLKNLSIPTQTVAVGATDSIQIILSSTVTDTVRDLQGKNATSLLNFTFTS